MTTRATGLDDPTRDLTLATIRRLGEDLLAPAATLAWDAADAVPEEVLRRLLGPDVGLHRVFLPAEVGGSGGAARDIYRVGEELARLDLGVATAFLGLAISVNPIARGGTPEQRQRWLGWIAAGGRLTALAVTEPEAGSNVGAVATVATPVAEGGRVTGYRLRGAKQFVTNGGLADLYLVLARAPGGPSFFVLEAGTPGLGVGRREAKHGLRSSATTALTLDEALVPADHLLGLAEGRGLEQAYAVYAASRVMVAAFGLGAGEAALARALAYAQVRHQGGKPLWQHKGFMNKLLLGPAVRLEAARAGLEELTRRLDAGEADLEAECAAVKLFATEAGNAAADAALQAFGGYGYMRDYVVEKIRRDVRVTTIYEGTSEMQQASLYLARFRQVLRGKGGCYQAAAAPVAALGASVGGELVARVAEALGQALWALHGARVSREQHVMFELADRIAEVEHALAFCRRAAGGPLPLQAACRLFAGDTAARVATSTMRLMATSRAAEADAAALAAAVRPDELLGARIGTEDDREAVTAWLLESGWPG